jgi:hypothetical protein
MRNKAIEYPHPVLNEYTRDYLNGRFAIDVLSHTDNGSEMIIELECQIDCDGLIRTIAAGDAKAIIRLTCYRTSLREMYDLNPSGSTIIRIAKKNVTDSIDLQAMIVATRELNKFRLPEFNSDYFGSFEFKIRKGYVLANEPGIKIKLNTMLEKNMAGIVQVRGDRNSTDMSVHFAEITEERPDLTDYIVITLPDMDYKNYARMMTKKHLKNGVERFVQASVILPAITEAVGKLRTEETTVGDDGDTVTHYKGTVWADSIYAALVRYGISDLSQNQMSDYEIANILLGNVASDSISNLMQKLTEWSTLREEDPTL